MLNLRVASGLTPGGNMTGFAGHSDKIRFLEEGVAVSFLEAAEPVLRPDHETAMNDLWQRWVERNPTVFDGPVVAITAINESEPGRIEFSWARTTYRRHLLRQVPGAETLVPVFVAVLQPTSAGVLLGRMADWTASGQRWVLPGGTMEPPAPGQPLDEDLLRAHAARELAEETGLDPEPADLTRWAIARNPNGNIGFFYRAHPITDTVARACFTQHLAELRRRSEQPELTQIHLAEQPYRFDTLDGPVAETVPALLARFASITASGL